MYDGPDYQAKRDYARLAAQTKRIFDLMSDGKYRTLREISLRTGDPESSVSAQLRHLRKERFGGHVVEKLHIQGGLYKYRLLVKEETDGLDTGEH